MGKKKKLGSDPLDSIDILKGPAQDTGKDTGKNAGDNASKDAGKNTGKNTRNNTSENTSDYTSKNTSKNTGINTSKNTRENTSVLTKKPEPVKMTFYFYPGQLKELDRLSKKTGRPKTELIRLALDLFIEQVSD